MQLFPRFSNKSTSPVKALAGTVAEKFFQILGKDTKPRKSYKEYKALRAAFDAKPTEKVAKALQEMIGTTTDFRDVAAAMDSEFDLEFYLLSYPDIRAHTKEGEIHYLLWGWKEARNPSRFFDHKYYTDKNKDIEEDEFVLAHYLKNKGRTGEVANPISDKFWFTPCVPNEAAWGSVAPAKRSTDTRAVVIIPVYKGYDETLTSIYQALSARNGDPYSLLVVNDKSPDEKLSTKLLELASKDLFDYFDSPINRGFVQTINYALENLSEELDVVLLNSDAYVFDGWFGRLIKHADQDESVATITPLSNNATICSYPCINEDNYHALELSPQGLDSLAGQVNRGLSAEAPTGVGFCFYMRRSVINEIGLLDDDAFKVGYGEENDFCMRALNAGYKNIIVGDVFVFHTGSVSFSSIKDENFAKGQLALEYKHPNYLHLVRKHIAADPELRMRRNLDAARLVAGFKGCTFFITHRWAGGIETYLEQTQKALKARGKKSVILRVHDLHFASIEQPADGGPFVPNLEDIDLRIEWDFLLNLIQDLSPETIHINSFAGLNWALHKQLLTSITHMGSPVTFIGHDYSPISHYYQLIRPDNAYVDIPDLATREKWNWMKDRSGSFDACDPKERLDAYVQFFKNVDRVEVPSVAARNIYKQAFPSLEIKVVEHEDHLPDTTEATRRSPDGILRIATIGAIGPHKGGDVLAGLAADAKNKDLLIEYHIIGYSNDNDYFESQGVEITGHYASEADAFELIDEIQPDLILIPSIWPETFCYTLSIALKKKIPPVVFNLGAQAERVSKIDWGVILPFSLANNPSALTEELMAIPVDDLWRRRSEQR